MRLTLLLPTTLLAALTVPPLGAQEVPRPAEETSPGSLEPKRNLELTSRDGKTKFRVTTTTIGFNDPAMNGESLTPGPGGKRVAYMVMTGTGVSVMVDGKPSAPFEGVGSDSIRFSPDGTRVAFAGQREGKQYIVVDGREYEYQGVGGEGVRFSPDSKRAAWIGAGDGQQFAVIDGEPEKRYDGIWRRGVLFSEVGENYAYVANIDGKQRVVLNGVELEECDEVIAMRFAPGGSLCLAVGIRADKWVLMCDGVEIGEFDSIGDGPRKLDTAIAFSKDGKRYGFVARDGEDWTVYIDGKPGKTYKGAFSLDFSPGGTRWAHLASDGGPLFLVVDGVEQKGVNCSSVTFSQDDKRLGVVVNRIRSKQQFVMIDDKEGPEYRKIQEPGILFSADGEHYLYVASKEGDRRVVIDGKESEAFPRLGPSGIGFIGNSGRAIYSVLRRSRHSVVIDGVESPPFKTVRAFCTPTEGSDYAYAAELDEGQWVIVWNGDSYGASGKFTGDPERDVPYDFVTKRTPVFGNSASNIAWSAHRGGKTVVVHNGVEGPEVDHVQRGTLSFSPDDKHLVYAAAIADKRYLVVDGTLIENGYAGFLQTDEITWADNDSFFIRGSSLTRFLLIEVSIES